jgi:hypothetical protein
MISIKNKKANKSGYYYTKYLGSHAHNIYTQLFPGRPLLRSD